MSKNNQISYVKQEPAFVRNFKKQIGYIEGPDVDTKRALLPRDENEDSDDLDEEKPLVVVLKKGDMTEEEVDRHHQFTGQPTGDSGDKTPDDECGESGRILFRQPVKRLMPDIIGITASSSKKKKESLEDDPEKPKVKSIESSAQKLSNPSLLSFGQEDLSSGPCEPSSTKEKSEKGRRTKSHPRKIIKASQPVLSFNDDDDEEEEDV